MDFISLENATVRREGKIILDNVSFKSKEGEHIAIIGPNGAGKSTLINVLYRSVYPLKKDDYRNVILGSERWITSEIRKRVSLVSQTEADFINTGYRAIDIVCSALYSSLGFDFHHVVKKEDYSKAEHELDRVGMLDKKNRPVNTLSSGELKRILLARANITKPSLLLLDEATSALDFPSRADFRELVRSYTKESTVIMVTHELSEILPEVKRVIAVKNGQIFLDGKKDEVLTQKNLSLLYERKVHLEEEDGIYSAFC